jgi:large subunit ribosomal protein L1
MAKTKADWLKEAKDLGIEVDNKAKISEVKEAIEANSKKADKLADEPNAAEQPKTDEADVAKAGKHSAKSIKEAEEKQAKEERKASGEAADVKPKKVVKPARPGLERRAKGFRKSAEQIEKGKLYNLEQAVELAKKTSHVKFDATVELHARLGVDPRQADQNIRDNLVLPAGTGKSVRIAALTDDAEGAKKAGADLAGNDDLLAELEKGNMNFDVLIATPALMSKLGKHARTLGPRGLMPNPKSGTVTNDIAKAVAEAKAGRVEYRVDSTGIVHLGIGKVSFTPVQLLQNAKAVTASIMANKPQSLKGNYIKSLHVTTSMGPSIPVDPAGIGSAA